jgi:hypothetical protein
LHISFTVKNEIFYALRAILTKNKISKIKVGFTDLRQEKNYSREK